MMKNIARLVLSLLVASALACAVTIAQPSGLIILKGQTKEYVNEIIQTPFVSVETGGTLILRGTTLLIDGASEGAGNIWVKPGATMRILNNSNITSANSYNYTFWVDAGATFEMRDSKISRCGYGATEKNMGLYVQTNDAVIENSIFGNNHQCLLLNGANNAKVVGNQFNECELQAVLVKYLSSAEISSNEFSINDEQLDSLSLSSCLSTIVSDNVFENPYGIGLLKTNSSVIKNNEFKDASGYSITISTSGSDSKENLLENNIIAGKLFVRGMSNTVKGGSVKNELYI